jgi:acyl-CoA synthetase (AMP-forming)/AMP-acid ligase II
VARGADHSIGRSLDDVDRLFRSSFPDEGSGFRTDAWRTGTARSAAELRPLFPTLPHAFAAAARADATTGVTLIPDDEDLPEEHRSWRQLFHEARAFAGGLAARNVRRGDRVLLVLPTSWDFLLAFFGVSLLGAVPVPAYPPAVLEKAGIALDRLAAIVDKLQIAWCITNDELLALVGDLALRQRGLQLLSSDALAAGDPAAAPKLRAAPDDAALVQCTSGSTGVPKGVLLAQRALVANIHAMGQAGRVSRHDVMVSWLPLYHDMGLIGTLLFPVYWRMPLVLLSPLAFLQRPGRWLWAIHRHKGTASAAPNFAYGLCVKRVRPPEREGLDLSSWRLTLNGAEPVNLRTVTDFLRTFAPHGLREETMRPVYGLAESCVAVTCSVPGEPVRHEVVDRSRLAAGHAVPATGRGSTALVALGRAIPGHEVAIVDANGRALTEREVGHIVVSGPSLMTGYVNDPEATRAVLRDGVLWTGDLGFTSGGQLFVTGRAKDLIIVRGRNHYPEDLERVAERIDGVRPGGVVAFAVYDEAKAAELAVVVCETRMAEEAARELAQTVRDRVGEHCAITVDEVVLVAPGAIPRTSSGKRQRSLCRELYLAGTLGKTRTGKLQLAVLFVRSRAGVLLSSARRLLAKQRAPE